MLNVWFSSFTQLLIIFSIQGIGVNQALPPESAARERRNPDDSPFHHFYGRGLFFLYFCSLFFKKHIF